MPVVSTEAGGVPAILRHGEHGLLAPLGDDRALASHVLALLDAPALSRRMTQAARGIAESCTWPAVRDEWLRVYRSVLPMSARTAVAIRGHVAQ